jgi:hypothetical protein
LRYLVSLMIVAFFGSGLLLVVVFLRELCRKLARRHRLRSADGVVTSVVKKAASRGPGRVRWRTYWRFFPVVTFTPPGGFPVTFTSEVGDGGTESRYRPGQRLAVRYDPDGEIPPTLDCWSALWLPPLLGIFSGLVFLFGAALTYWTVGERVLGR